MLSSTSNPRIRDETATGVVITYLIPLIVMFPLEMTPELTTAFSNMISVRLVPDTMLLRIMERVTFELVMLESYTAESIIVDPGMMEPWIMELLDDPVKIVVASTLSRTVPSF